MNPGLSAESLCCTSLHRSPGLGRPDLPDVSYFRPAGRDLSVSREPRDGSLSLLPLRREMLTEKRIRQPPGCNAGGNSLPHADRNLHRHVPFLSFQGEERVKSLLTALHGGCGCS